MEQKHLFLQSPQSQLTYPLDTLRLRLAVDPSLTTVRAASAALFREGAYPAFFRGLSTALIGGGACLICLPPADEHTALRAARALLSPDCSDAISETRTSGFTDQSISCSQI